MTEDGWLRTSDITGRIQGKRLDVKCNGAADSGVIGNAAFRAGAEGKEVSVPGEAPGGSPA